MEANAQHGHSLLEVNFEGLLLVSCMFLLDDFEMTEIQRNVISVSAACLVVVYKR